MHHAPSPFHSQHARPATPGAIEWEELPSLAGRLAGSLVRRFGTFAHSPWDSTRPAELETGDTASQPFREPVQGVAVREVTEPDVFRHFFGR